MLLTVVIFVVFDVPALLTVVRLVVFETPALLTVVRLLLTVASPAVAVRLVIKEPSPIKRPKTLPAEIVEKKPNEVDIDIAEILDTARRKLVVLLTVVILVVFETPTLLTVVRLLLTVVSPAVTGRLVIKEPSPTKRPNTLPAEIVEKKPNEVDIDTAEILDTARRKLVVLLTVVILVVFETTELLTVVRLLLTVVIFPELVTPVLLTETKAEESEISDPLLIVAAYSIPTVKLLAVPAPVLNNAVFSILNPAVPTLIELNVPASVKSEPIEPLLIDPARRRPIVNVLTKPKAVLNDLTDKVSISAFPPVTELNIICCVDIVLTLRESVASCPESNRLPLSYPDSAATGIVAFAYTAAGKLPTMRAAGILVKPIPEPVKLLAVATPITRELPVKVVAPVIFVGPTIRTPPASTISKATVGVLIPIPTRLFKVSMVIVARLPSKVDILQRAS